MRRNKNEERTIAHERIARLVALARAALREGKRERADRYAELSWRLKTRYQLGPAAIDGHVCRACHAFLVPGLTSRVRFREGKRIVTCLACGHVRRRPLAVRSRTDAP